MKKLHAAVAYCVREQRPCVRWVDQYFDDCLCNRNDYFSFAFGFLSLLCWGIAEIPQIITNFRSKSSHGISLIFLLTWIAGDIFNLVGCLLEPATLPTQYYTAVLYTASTIVLVLQSIYYDYFYSWWKSRKMENHPKIEDDKNTPNPQKPADSGIPIPFHNPTAAAAATNSQREYYYASARSMASGSTPPTWSYLRAARSGPPVMGLDHDYSSSDDENHHNRRRSAFESPPPPPTPPSRKSRTKPQPIPRSVGSATILASSLGMLPGSNAFLAVGRKLLHEQAGVVMMEGNSAAAAAYGQWLGWMMAAIYMGGRIPQIWLNIKRGSVEGLNPLMFVFALIANAAYVASILARTIEWGKIKANLPWLLDAAVCVGLDLFIILQFIYYKNLRRRRSRREMEEERLVDTNKPLLS